MLHELEDNVEKEIADLKVALENKEAEIEKVRSLLFATTLFLIILRTRTFQLVKSSCYRREKYYYKFSKSYCLLYVCIHNTKTVFTRYHLILVSAFTFDGPMVLAYICEC